MVYDNTKYKNRFTYFFYSFMEGGVSAVSANLIWDSFKNIIEYKGNMFYLYRNSFLNLYSI